MSTLICETVTGGTMAELLAGREAATGDLVELRLDGVADLDVAAALAGRRTPVVATCRASWESGRFEGSEEQRKAVLAQALAAGAEFVDIEWKSGFADLVTRAPDRIVLSHHDFGGVPSDLQERARAMRATGAGVIKIAVTTARLSDTLPLMEIGRGGDAVVIGMGEAGVPTRLLASRFGSRWTYAGNAVAPGQIPTARMVGHFGVRRIGPNTKVYGVISTNAMHSLSPVMHNAAFQAAGLDAVYIPLRAADFDDFLTFAAGIGVDGGSVTIPFKLDALHAASRIDELTRMVGAANTLRCGKDGWEATNTDVHGFLAPLESAFGRSVHGARASVLGAGGSARAVVVALTGAGAHVTVHARHREQAMEITDSLGAAIGPWPPAPRSWDLLVNCTPLGGANLRDESPLDAVHLDGAFVYDLTYGAGDSKLVADAKTRGLRTLDGLPMLVAQAEKQFEWWTGQRPPAGVMERAIRQHAPADAFFVQQPGVARGLPVPR